MYLFLDMTSSIGSPACHCMVKPGRFGTIASTDQCDTVCNNDKQLCRTHAIYTIYSLWGMLVSLLNRLLVR